VSRRIFFVLGARVGCRTVPAAGSIRRGSQASGDSSCTPGRARKKAGPRSLKLEHRDRPSASGRAARRRLTQPLTRKHSARVVGRRRFRRPAGGPPAREGVEMRSRPRAGPALVGAADSEDRRDRRRVAEDGRIQLGVVVAPGDRGPYGLLGRFTSITRRSAGSGREVRRRRPARRQTSAAPPWARAGRPARRFAAVGGGPTNRGGRARAGRGTPAGRGPPQLRTAEQPAREPTASKNGSGMTRAKSTSANSWAREVRGSRSRGRRRRGPRRRSKLRTVAGRAAHHPSAQVSRGLYNTESAAARSGTRHRCRPGVTAGSNTAGRRCPRRC